MESEFRNFCRSLSVEHVTTPPYHPMLNEQAKRFVDTFKMALKKNNGLDMEESSWVYIELHPIQTRFRVNHLLN